ncbi:hypothetical protein JCM10449v2_001175 [Rhodotorula kratochvilovae]
MATATVEHCLATLLAQNDAVPAHLAHLVDLVSNQRILVTAERQEGTHGPVLHRWQLRLVALVHASNAPAVRAAGFQLLHHSFTASISLLLAAGKPALAAAQAVLASPKSDPNLFIAALELARLVLAKSTWHPEWARDNVGAQFVQKLVGSLFQAASVELSDVKLPCVAAIVSLIPLYPTALRPLSPNLHNLAISLVVEPSGNSVVVEAGASLFASLYLLAPKGKEGLREAWRTGVEALVGSIDTLTTQVTNGIFAEDMTFNHTLSPLALPPLVDASPISTLTRLESLHRVLLRILRTPTTEKAGLVPLPLGALTELGVRLTSLSSLTPVRERTDPSLLTAVLSLLPRVQLLGAQLLAQLALAAGPHLAPHAGAVLAALSGTLNAYAPREPMRPVLSGAYALVLEALGACVDPEEGKKSLARVWRTVLEDVGGVAMEPVVVSAGGKEDAAKGGSRKAKRQKTYDPGESMASRRIALDEVDVELAERGLATLERLLRCPFSHFLPPALQLATSRMLLYLALSPAAFTSHALAAPSASFYPSTSALSALDIARQSPALRAGILSALLAALASGTCAPSGTAERAAEVFRRAALLSTDARARALALEGLALLRQRAHPDVPAQQPNSGLARVRHERSGGWVGAEEEWEASAGEFRIRVVERAAEDGDEDEEEEEEGNAEEGAAAERRRKTPPAPAAPAVTLAPAPAQTAFPATTAFAAPATAKASGFAAFAAPAFGSAPAPAAPAREEVDVVASASFSEVVSSSSKSGKVTTTLDVETVASSSSTVQKAVPRAGAEEESGESEDEGMPMIDVGSDEE